MDKQVTDLIDLTNPVENILLNMTPEEARRRVASGDPKGVGEIDGQFAIVAREGQCVRMARSIGRLMRYFIAKQAAGPLLIVAHHIRPICDTLARQGMLEQFHPSYTRMVPAHFVTEVQLVGCPDPSPTHHRFFDPPMDVWECDVQKIGRRYIAALARAIDGWLDRVPGREPIGVCFSAPRKGS